MSRAQSWWWKITSYRCKTSFLKLITKKLNIAKETWIRDRISSKVSARPGIEPWPLARKASITTTIPRAVKEMSGNSSLIDWSLFDTLITNDIWLAVDDVMLYIIATIILKSSTIQSSFAFRKSHFYLFPVIWIY